MTNDTLKQELNKLGIELSERQYKRIEMLIRSGKIDSFTIKKLLLPKIPDFLIDESLDVISQIEIRL